MRRENQDKISRLMLVWTSIFIITVSVNIGLLSRPVCATSLQPQPDCQIALARIPVPAHVTETRTQKAGKPIHSEHTFPHGLPVNAETGGQEQSISWAINKNKAVLFSGDCSLHINARAPPSK